MSIEVYTGPMMSGKTTKAIKRVTRYMDVLGGRALFINSQLDNRDASNKISSHSSMYKGLSDKIDIQMTTLLKNVDVSNHNIIGVDEAQFFKDLEIVIDWAKSGKIVVVSGLDGDFKGNSFGNIRELLPKAEIFVKLTAICSLCLEEMQNNGVQITADNLPPAAFTRRMKDQGEIVVDIGGSDKYKSVCRRHHEIP